MAADTGLVALNRRGLFFSAAANPKASGFGLFEVLIAQVLNRVGAASADFLPLRIASLRNLIKKLFCFFSRGVGSPRRTIFADCEKALAAFLVAKHQNEGNEVF